MDKGKVLYNNEKSIGIRYSC